MVLEKIILKYENQKFPLVIDTCNILKQMLGLMVFRKKALLLFDFKKYRKLKIHSFFCSPFIAVYTDEENNIQEIINVTSWRSSILPVDKFRKLIEIPLTRKYSKLVKGLLEAPIPLNNNKSPSIKI